MKKNNLENEMFGCVVVFFGYVLLVFILFWLNYLSVLIVCKYIWNRDM